jgi:hypothetical protein
MEHDIQLISALRGILSQITTAQGALHKTINDNTPLSKELNDLWAALDKTELVIRRILQ